MKKQTEIWEEEHMRVLANNRPQISQPSPHRLFSNTELEGGVMKLTEKQIALIDRLI